MSTSRDWTSFVFGAALVGGLGLVAYLNRQFVLARTQALYDELIEHMDEHMENLHGMVHEDIVDSSARAVVSWMSENHRRLVPAS